MLEIYKLNPSPFEIQSAKQVDAEKYVNIDAHYGEEITSQLAESAYLSPPYASYFRLKGFSGFRIPAVSHGGTSLTNANKRDEWWWMGSSDSRC